MKPVPARNAVGLWMLLALTVALLGCGPARREGGRLTVPELGLTLTLPPGWKLDRQNPRLCSKGNATGLVVDEPLAAAEFPSRVDRLCRENQGQLRSQSTLTVNGHPGRLVVIEYPAAGSAAMNLFLHKADTLIEISFVTPAEHFAAEESALRAALQAVELK